MPSSYNSIQANFRRSISGPDIPGIMFVYKRGTYWIRLSKYSFASAILVHAVFG